MDVVSIRNAGIGDCTWCAAVAWYVATVRVRSRLVISWSKSKYLDEGVNLFPRLFNIPTALGVEVVAPDDYLPPDNFANERNISRGACFRAALPGLVMTRGSGMDQTLGMQIKMKPSSRRFFFSRLGVVTEVESMVGAFESAHAGKHLIGLHVRAGNGEFTDFDEDVSNPHNPFASSREIPDIDAYIEKLKGELGGDHFDGVFVSCDSAPLLEKIKTAIPNCYHLDRWLPDEGQGPPHNAAKQHSPDALQTARDDLAEMLLLSNRQWVVKTPRGKFGTFCDPRRVVAVKANIYGPD